MFLEANVEAQGFYEKGCFARLSGDMVVGGGEGEVAVRLPVFVWEARGGRGGGWRGIGLLRGRRGGEVEMEKRCFGLVNQLNTTRPTCSLVGRYILFESVVEEEAIPHTRSLSQLLPNGL